MASSLESLLAAPALGKDVTDSMAAVRGIVRTLLKAERRGDVRAALTLVEEAAFEAWLMDVPRKLVGSPSTWETRDRIAQLSIAAGVEATINTAAGPEVTHPLLSLKSHHNSDVKRIRRVDAAVRHLSGELPSNEHTVWVRKVYSLLKDCSGAYMATKTSAHKLAFAKAVAILLHPLLGCEPDTERVAAILESFPQRKKKSKPLWWPLTHLLRLGGFTGDADAVRSLVKRDVG